MSRADMTHHYVEGIFKHAQYSRFSNLMKHDIVLVISDGVLDNLGEARLEILVGKAYQDHMAPLVLSQAIVSEAMAVAYESSGKPDDTTCAAAYLWEL